MVGFGQFVCDGVVERLEPVSAYKWDTFPPHCHVHTGPVTVLLDLVAHVPTKSTGHVPAAADALGAAL